MHARVRMPPKRAMLWRSRVRYEARGMIDAAAA
jgi:hypothetical protein